MAEIKRVERKDGSVAWRMRVFAGRDPTGKRKFVTMTFVKKTDAEKEARRLERAKDKGDRIGTSKEPLGEYLKRWMETKSGQLADRTADDYRGVLRRYVWEPSKDAPAIASVRLDRLNPDIFEALYNHMYNDLKLAPRTITYLHVILHQALKAAVKKRIIAQNPTVLADRPTVAKTSDDEEEETTVRAMSKDESDLFLEASKKDRYFAFWNLLLNTGLRPSEAFGLKWMDVDFDESRVIVRRVLTRRGLDRERHPKGWKLAKPKTKKARRSVPIPKDTVAAIQRWRAIQGRERLQAGSEYEDSGFVFSTAFGKPLEGSGLYNRNYRSICRAAGLGQWGEGKRGKKLFRPAYRIYDLRHTHATLLLRKGVNLKVVSERLGHSTIALTGDIYSHVLSDMQEDAVAAMEALFGSDS